MHQKYC